MYMLDTNMASYLIKGNSQSVRNRISAVSPHLISISSITEGELLFGLARAGEPKALRKLTDEFLLRVQVMPWDRDAAQVYGALRASCVATGRILGAMDMLIAAHALATGAILVTHGQAFQQLSKDGLTMEDWAKDK
jgi:tRNA(fMet)-specific endonuclease VapC